MKTDDRGPLLEVRELTKVYPRRTSAPGSRGQSSVKAVDGISFSVWPGESFGLIGESGSGKSTTARCVLGLEVPSTGQVRLNGGSVRARSKRDRVKLARAVQAVFQDPVSSLDPRMTVQKIVEEPLRILNATTPGSRQEAARLALDSVGLSQTIAGRYRHQLSGGQQQRVSIARAFVSEPQLIVLDEPVSALDASVRGQVLALLARLRNANGVSYLSISHDLATVKSTCDRVGVMCRGQLLELGSVEQVFGDPQHRYTRSLLAASLDSFSKGGQSMRTTDVVTSEDIEPTGAVSLREFSPGHFVAE